MESSISVCGEPIGDEMSHHYLIDYHVHESHSRDAPTATLPALIRAAEENGVREMALTTHLIVTGPDVALSVQPDELPGYFKAIEKAQDDTDVHLRASLEVDYFPGFEAELEAVIEEYPLDFSLGSLHYVNGVDVGSRVDARRFFEGKRYQRQ